MARTSAPLRIELTSSGIHVVKGVKAREEVFVPWEAVTKVELRTRMMKWRKKMMDILFPEELGFTAVDVCTAKGGVEEVYVRSNDLPNLVGALKELGVAVAKS